MDIHQGTPSEAPAPASRPGATAWTLFSGALAAVAIIVVVIATLAVSAYRVAEVTQPDFAQDWVWALGHSFGLVLLAGLWALVALFWRTQPFRSYAIALTGLAGFGAALGAARTVGALADDWRSVATIVIALIWLALGWALARRRGSTVFGLRAGGLAVALAAGLVLLAPWLVFGALDSWGGVLTNLAVGLVVGLAAAQWLTTWVLEPGVGALAGWRRATLAGGFVASAGLLWIGVSLGANGLQMVYGPAVAALGLLVAWLDRAARDRGSRGGWAIALLIGLVIAVALSTFDPEEQGLYLLEDSVGLWATAASALGTLLALVLGSVGLLLGESLSRWSQRVMVGAAASVGAGVIVIGLYAGLGHPGLYGERLFVVMRDQADLTTIDPTLDQKARAAAVFAALTTEATRSQADLRSTLDGLGIAYKPYYLVNALEVDGGSLLHLYLSTRSDVAEVMVSQHLRPVYAVPAASTGDPAGPTGPEWNIVMIGADRVWSEFAATGAGIVIGQSDSGVDGRHPALAGQYRGRTGGDDYNWLDPWEATRTPTDRGGHGTHTLGTILGQGGIGVAPDAEWFGCRNLARNLGNPALYLDCMQFMLAPYPLDGNAFADGDPTRGAQVLNNSWGCPTIEGCQPDALGPGVAALRMAGIFVVASAGNEGPGCSSIKDPIATYDGAFSVAAVDEAGQLADFSSRGPVPGTELSKPDIAAPGVNVFSSVPGNTYTHNSGTSMAGPHIVGVVALMWSANPRLIGDIETTERILRETAQPYTGDLSAPDCDLAAHPEWGVGAGVVDAYAAVKAAIALP